MCKKLTPQKQHRPRASSHTSTHCCSDTEGRSTSTRETKLLDSTGNKPVIMKDTPTQLRPKTDRGSKRLDGTSATGYLGVQVRMPVRDLLRKLRLSKGFDPSEIQRYPGERKRVTTSGTRKKRQNQLPSEALEDLAIIVEVLEEDLKANKLCRCIGEFFPSPYFPHSIGQQLGETLPSCLLKSIVPGSGPVLQRKVFLTLCLFSDREMQTTFTSSSQTPLPSPGGHPGSSGDEAEDLSPHHMVIFTHNDTEYKGHSSQEFVIQSNSSPCYWDSLQDQARDPHGYAATQWSWETQPFFQLQPPREENLLRSVSDLELPEFQKGGGILLHNVVSQRRRCLASSIGQQIASVNWLDVKDARGQTQEDPHSPPWNLNNSTPCPPPQTALHLAAQRNQHLLLSDLILLGADVNVRDGLGRTCLHLSAEKGNFRTLEVLRNFMNSGVHINVKAKDMNGNSALHCAVEALHVVDWELEFCTDIRRVEVLTLQKEHLKETMKCLLQMEELHHTQTCRNKVIDGEGNLNIYNDVARSAVQNVGQGHKVQVGWASPVYGNTLSMW
ncbi:uncharacterized protein [Paramormyrops kingsleyae]|uniref:uncharacterized protein isoform X1 n=1 Tax=Paramormyrops kingsleyae TaxID=1676925 RepID=UPI000CD61D1F|nr:uncharacterized protein LOC111846242 isoform X1 [Paramormyrops kingsleyae]